MAKTSPPANAKPLPAITNDEGGTNWKAYYAELMQTLMRNNPSAVCYDIMGKRIARRDP
jgi:hypothetical protein